VHELSVVGALDGRLYLKLENVIGVDPVLGLAAVQDQKSVRVIRLGDGEILAVVAGTTATGACFAADGSRVGLILENQRYASLPLALDKERLRERARLLVTQSTATNAQPSAPSPQAK
jgi:hypothetical protein